MTNNTSSYKIVTNKDVPELICWHTYYINIAGTIKNAHQHHIEANTPTINPNTIGTIALFGLTRNLI